MTKILLSAFVFVFGPVALIIAFVPHADANTHNHFANCHYAVTYPLSGEYAVRNRTTKNVYREQAVNIIENNFDAISTNNLTILGTCR